MAEERLRWAGSLAAQQEHEEALRKVGLSKPVYDRSKPRKKRKTKQGLPIRGKGSTFRRNGVKTYQEYLQTKHWKHTRKLKLKRVGHRCQRCRSRNNLQVHHKHYHSLWREKLTDLEVLCNSCHKAHHEIWELDPDAKSHLDSIGRQVL